MLPLLLNWEQNNMSLIIFKWFLKQPTGNGTCCCCCTCYWSIVRWEEVVFLVGFPLVYPNQYMYWTHAGDCIKLLRVVKRHILIFFFLCFLPSLVAQDKCDNHIIKFSTLPKVSKATHSPTSCMQLDTCNMQLEDAAAIAIETMMTLSLCLRDDFSNSIALNCTSIDMFIMGKKA